MIKMINKKQSYKKVIFVCLISALVFSFVQVVYAEEPSSNSCVVCHKNLEPGQKTDNLTGLAKTNYENWLKSKHAQVGVTCEKCHGGNPDVSDKENAHIGVKPAKDENSTVYFRNVPTTCGKCHTNELDHFKNSMHYQRLQALKQGPTCDTCHRYHTFKVLSTDEFQNLCSTCHNEKGTGIAPSDAPEKAKLALENVENLRKEITAVEDQIQKAKLEKKDTTDAEKDLQKAKDILAGIPVEWHQFNLDSFDTMIQDGINEANNSQKWLNSQYSQKVSKTPGFEIPGALLGLLVAVYGIRKKIIKK